MKDKVIYLIGGKARTGKGTVSKIIKEEYEKKGYKVCEIQIMRTLKNYLKDYFDWDGLEDTKPRKLLQEMGYDLIRDKMNMPYFHIDHLTDDIKVLSNFFDIFIVSDIRLPIEIDTIKERFNNVISINIIKDNYISPLKVDEVNHITETALDNYKNFDYKLVNSNLDELKNDIIKIVDSEVSKNEIHD